jgi:hypothetical protein
MKQRVATLLLVCGAVVVLSGDGGRDHAAALGDGTRPGAMKPAAGVVAPGMVLHIDPATGQFTDSPSAQQMKELSAALAPGLNTSDNGLTVRKNAGPGGGVMIDLQGRFQNTSIAVVDEHGKLQTTCAPGSETEKTGEGE